MQEVEAAEGRHRGCDGCPDFFGAANVGLLDHHSAPRRLNAPRGLRGGGGVDVRDQHSSPLGSEHLGDRPSDSGTGASDESYSVRELHAFSF